LREIAKACHDTGAYSHFIKALFACEILSETETGLTMKTDGTYDIEALAHNIGAAIGKDVVLNDFWHEHNVRHYCGPMNQAPSR
jgi:hypothetical protein